jgi:ATPase family associated with various cellular activities (AAA)
MPSEDDVKKWSNLDTKISYSGKAITLPSDPHNMPIRAAIIALKRKEEEENTTVQVHEIIDAYPHDAAVAFIKAMVNIYGWASPVPTPGFWGDSPPTFLSVKTGKGHGDVVQCPIGSFKLPNVDDRITTVITQKERRDPKLYFIIHAEVKQKFRHILVELAAECRRIVNEESIYRGKAIRLNVNDEGQLDMNVPPDFMDTSHVNEESLIFNDDIRAQIYTNILVPIKNQEECRRHNIPMKRGILLEGPYGTGKSLTAAMVARVCEENNVTFILLNKVQGLKTALELAVRFGHSVVFSEDIDLIAQDRDDKMNDLILVIDGVVSKSSPIMTILTTNHVERLNPVILRPGRLDAIISVREPDPDTVQRLIRHYAGSLIGKDEDLSRAGKEMAGQIPATIRECVERAKLGMIGRGATTLTDHDLSIAALTMKNHLALLKTKGKSKTHAENLAESLHNVVIGNGLDTDEEYMTN